MNHKQYRQALGKKLKEMTREEVRTYHRLARGGPLIKQPRPRISEKSKAEYRRKRRKAGQDKWLEQQDKEYHYAASHHCKIKKKYPVASNSSLDTGKIAAWLRTVEHRCYLCGDECLGIDHVIPLSRGGEHELHNMRICCVSCNSIKNDKTLEELESCIPKLVDSLETTLQELQDKISRMKVVQERLATGLAQT